MITDRTMIVIRERSFMDLLDLALLVVRRYPVTLGLAAAVGIAPFAALNVWLLSFPEFQRFFWVPLLAMEAPWATAPITMVLGDLMFGLRIRPARLFVTFLSSLPALFLTQILMRGFLLVLIVFYPFVVPTRYGFLDEAILLEREPKWRAWKSLMRSRALSRGVEMDFFMRWVGQIAIGVLFALCFWMGAETVIGALFDNELTWYRPGLGDLSGMLFQTGIWLAIAYFGVVRFLSYIDRRIRLEGWEIELRLKALGRALEEKEA
jgi:hypothetical protein